MKNLEASRCVLEQFQQWLLRNAINGDEHHRRAATSRTASRIFTHIFTRHDTEYTLPIFYVPQGFGRFFMLGNFWQ